MKNSRYNNKQKDNPKPEHEVGMHFGAPSNIFIYAKELRTKLTLEEKILWDKLRNKLLGYKFRRQHPLYKYIADFYCHRLRYVIEIDGPYHLNKLQKQYDIKRSDEMNELGIFVRRFKNEEIQNNLADVLVRIQADLKLREKILHQRLNKE